MYNMCVHNRPCVCMQSANIALYICGVSTFQRNIIYLNRLHYTYLTHTNTYMYV